MLEVDGETLNGKPNETEAEVESLRRVCKFFLYFTSILRIRAYVAVLSRRPMICR
jgi:hypothetical protein